jgi:arylsulfate sulfotransferase
MIFRNGGSVLLTLAASTTLCAQMSVSLSTSVNSPVTLGNVVTLTATASGVDAGVLSYRFRVRRLGTDFHTVVDFGPKSTLAWTTIDQEGSYELEVALKNNNTGDMAVSSSTLAMTPIAMDSTPFVTPTATPFVYIYSAPKCAPGSRMRVQFQSSDGITQTTPYKQCIAGKTMNFYLGGMRAGTQYTVQHTLDTGSAINAGPALTITTMGGTSTDPPAFTVLSGPAPQPTSVPNPILLQSIIGSPSLATDLNGNVIWQAPSDIEILTRALPGGTFLGIGQDQGNDPSVWFFREFDMAGITIAETNAARVNEQLGPMGIQPISGFHHEARKLPDGTFLVLADSERILTDVQGPGPVDVIGDTILVLNPDLQVLWAWDTFDHLDPHRMATLNEVCIAPAGLTCAPFFLSGTANDWLHGNALQLTPDGNILYSMRHQDLVIKIDYSNGSGTGNILWRLGNGGDFQITSSDPNPWFSHQHDPNFESNNTTLLLFDNGNVRQASDPNAHSRGQVLQIDEQNRAANVILNADTGVYSQAVGTAEQLPAGNYHFDAGYIYTVDSDGNASVSARSLQVDSSGQIGYEAQIAAAEYRAFRMRDLYTGQ